ncbi:HU domain-containing protein [Flavilitoribacter nigricans]|uniref:CCDC81-like prokaryotic HU domain-containing protein n=1 Tax=Flavilitoribacter nigricans (strain ATCC 23147 / DSM 23189 / NBRC 102662 / NCIMB 1420 / SS-2) TaxID=1122177 RepID=A0A2D0MZU5_FLAN2|nr:hypothetical protein [Flavilitoribacter nigricans]PHN00973.1 hypothetical protein CRP01_39520 [Flavilitoribacter nigricans DSM 23189 = NBRC 102662]
MQIRVDKYIQELLYENDSVNIPGLGGLVTEYQPAQIDHVQAKILPPARDVTLNTNLPIDDGLLTQRVADAHQLSGLEAEQVIRDYVESLQDALNSGEIIAIEGVGRLYKNHSGELHLMSDHNNFDTAAYGLPAVTSPVIQRQEIKPATAVVAPATAATTKDGADTWTVISDWFQQNLWIVVSAAMVVFVVTVWLLFFNDTQDPTSGLSEVKELPEDRVNVSPGDIEDDELVMEEPTAPGEEDNNLSAEEPAPSDNSTPPEEELDTESPTISPEQNVALIRIGLFGDRGNVTKLVQKIYDEGFEPYTREKGSLIEVGVQFVYDDQQEVRANLRAVQKKFEEKAKVVE